MSNQTHEDPGYDDLDRELNQRLNKIDRLADTFGSEWADEETARVIDEIAQRRTPTDAKFARAVSLFALTLALIAGTGNASAAETLTSPGGQTFPFIGTPQYSDSCAITHAWEDHSALAYCTEDGASYVYDPDGQWIPGIPDNPVRDPGWYPSSF